MPTTPANVHNGAVLFSQRCAGCHTLSYAGTHGSATNVRSREITDGPNFNVRCERPIARVLYAIVNGGFSGAIMPQNIVTGQQARDVAQFVATYAGRAAPKIAGQQSCINTPIGSLPPVGSTRHNVRDGPLDGHRTGQFGCGQVAADEYHEEEVGPGRRPSGPGPHRSVACSTSG